MADTRERLLARPDIPDDEVDDIIARAAVLQDADRAHEEGHATQAEVEAVAAELDIAPSYVDQAIAVIRQERQQQVEQAQDRSETRSRTLVVAGVALCGLLVLGALTVAAAGMLGAGSVNSAAQQVDRTAGKLDIALDRQVALAPQLVALAGADATAVKQAASQAAEAQGVDARIEAATTLNQAMAEAIGQIEADGDDQAQQRLLNLQHEVVGSWNRIDTERGRYQEADMAYERAAQSPTGSLALSLGLAGPPRAD